MPYFFIEDLPPSVRHYLPQAAQEIYRRAFNKVWDNYYDESRLPKGMTRVELAAKIAWAAVKHEYEKGPNMWRHIKKRHKCVKDKLVVKTKRYFKKTDSVI